MYRTSAIDINVTRNSKDMEN